ncbi:hypothetical protein ACWGNU_26910 [Paenibacillus lautus]
MAFATASSFVRCHMLHFPSALTGRRKNSGNSTRDIHVVSAWAGLAWEEITKIGIVDGIRPCAPVTREENTVMMNRLRKNLLQLIAGNSIVLGELEKRLQAIESECGFTKCPK